MNRTINWKRIRYLFGSAIAVGVAAVTINSVGCDNGSNATTAVFATDPYVYYSYYPADVSVAGYYWTDDWVYTGLFALNANGAIGPSDGSTATSAAGAAGSSATGGAAGAANLATPTATGAVTSVADAVRALARGETVCANQVTVTAKTRTPACTGGPTQSRAGVTIVFNACQTPGGGLITGTVDVTSTATASTATCTGTTMITVSHTTTITNLTYVAPSGFKAVTPQQTDTGTNTFTFGTSPATITLSSNGRLQTYAADGSLLSDTNFSGMPTISFGGSTSGYTIDGTYTTMDNRQNGAGATYVLTGLTRVASCCRPVAGTVAVTRTSGDNDSDNVANNTYTFGPTCGDISLDGQIVASIPACI